MVYYTEPECCILYKFVIDDPSPSVYPDHVEYNLISDSWCHGLFTKLGIL